MRKNNYSLQEVYGYAEKMGYNREDVTIKSTCIDYDWATDVAVSGYVVSFGTPYDKEWSWTFKSLDDKSIDFEYSEWED